MSDSKAADTCRSVYFTYLEFKLYVLEYAFTICFFIYYLLHFYRTFFFFF